MRGSRSGKALVGWIAAGAVVGTLAGQLLAHQVPILGHETAVRWHPQANLGVVSYDLTITFRVNWLTLLGVLVGYFLGRRAK
ncbi:DUF4321 domain-containing protein [Alicyclobacillus sp. SO9]|uniref:DUF4321 domain-containing protein n=1 Tax=Alicyclobacillus sp. SO9 TaxID=2665646 RepID=UPI0018E7D2E9|nr:DUF4321 domain-containing protein [Alicyclobacillus sp. SO9]QQE77008.1 DUF4321 domain-containing protein [Alicyclobacillus sp. SO9]